jgi:glycosyltransferase 2 family protein
VDDDEHQANRRWVLPLRIVVSIAMLAILWWKVPEFEPSDIIPEWTVGTALALTLALLLTFFGIVLSAVRWQKVLNALGLRARTTHLLNLYLACQFVSNVLPTTIGGDVLRVSRLSKENGETPRTFASVVLERLTGWIVLPIITFVGLLLNPGLRHLGSATLVAFALALATLSGLGLLLAIIAGERFGGHFLDRDGWRRFVGAVHFGVSELRKRPAATAEVLAAGLVYQLALVLAAVMAARVVGISDAAGITALLAFLPAGLIAQVFPLGISGLGVREAAFVLFLTPLGVASDQAIALGFLLYLLNLVVSLLGAPAFAFGAPKEPEPEQAVA